MKPEGLGAIADEWEWEGGNLDDRRGREGGGGTARGAGSGVREGERRKEIIARRRGRKQSEEKRR